MPAVVMGAPIAVQKLGRVMKQTQLIVFTLRGLSGVHAWPCIAKSTKLDGGTL